MKLKILKILTTPLAPEDSVLTGVPAVLSEARIGPQHFDIIIHVTTRAQKYKDRIDCNGKITGLRRNGVGKFVEKV